MKFERAVPTRVALMSAASKHQPPARTTSASVGLMGLAGSNQVVNQLYPGLAIHLDIFSDRAVCDNGFVKRGHKTPAVNLWVKGRATAGVQFEDVGLGLSPYPFSHIFQQDELRQHKGLNNRAENSHLPTRRRERIMKRYNRRGSSRSSCPFTIKSPIFFTFPATNSRPSIIAPLGLRLSRPGQRSPPHASTVE
jgi:hypothetical protein